METNEVQESYASKVQKLLTKAEGTSNEDEAQAFFAKAYELMAKHAITVAMLEKASGGPKSDPVTEAVVLGRNGAGIKARRGLLATLARFFDCRAVMSNDRATIFIFGYPDDVEATLKLFSSLEIQMAKALRATGNANASWKTNFMYGYANRVAVRLNEIKSSVRTEAETATPGTALVLRSKDVAVEAAMKTRFNRMRSGPPAKHTPNAAARGAGDAAGRSAVLEDRLGRGNGELNR